LPLGQGTDSSLIYLHGSKKEVQANDNLSAPRSLVATNCRKNTPGFKLLFMM